MGLAEILTIVFVVLKLTGFIGWEWWQVLLPEIIAFAFYMFILILNIAIYRRALFGAKKKK